MSQLQIRLFGGFQVHLNEQPIRFPTQKVRALFAYLSVEAKSAHPREKLMTLFWPEQSQNSASNNLRQTLSRLRAVLPADTILLRDNEIQFNLKSNHRVDVTAFVQAFSAKTPDDVAAASELYQGDFLAHFSLPDSPMFEEWALLKREWLRSEALKMLHHLTLAYEQAERHEDAIHAARRQVEIDSLHEVAWQQLMRNLALAGRRSEALDQFELCRQILEKELEVEPAQETTQLAQQIRNGQVVAQAAVQIQPLVSFITPSTPHFNVPTPLTPLVGREEELAKLATLLHDPTIRLLTILGPGGMGKSHLACELAIRQRDRFDNGVVFVALAALQSSEAVISAIAASLHFVFRKNTDPWSQLCDYLHEKQLLLVLDNFEHLLSVTPFITNLLENTSGLKCLITSRVALSAVSEQLFPLEGISVPSPNVKTIESVEQYSAVHLFAQTARRVKPGFQIDAQSQLFVVSICRYVQGMPLGILLATSWLQTLSLREIVEQMTDEQSNSTIGPINFGEYNSTLSLRQIFERSWRLLNDREQRMFQRLALFRGGFTQQAAKGVCGITIYDLRAFVNHSLIQSLENGRFELHELIRQFALEKLRLDINEFLATQQNHAVYFARFIYKHINNFVGPNRARVMSELIPDIDNIFQAWKYLLTQQDYPLLNQMISGLNLFFGTQGRFLEAKQLFQAAVIQLKPRMDSGDASLPLALNVYARTLLGHADYLRCFENSDELAYIYRQSEEIFNKAEQVGEDVRVERSWLYYVQAEICAKRDPERALHLIQQSLQLYPAQDDWDRLWWINTLLCDFYHWSDSSRITYKKCVDKQHMILEQLGDRCMLALTLSKLGLHAVEEFRFPDAIELQKKALSIINDICSESDRSFILSSVAMTEGMCGLFQQSNEHGVLALKIAREFGSNRDLRYSLISTNYSALHLGHYDVAIFGQNEAIRVGKMFRFEWDGELYGLLGMALLANNEWNQAHKVLTKGVELCQYSRINSVALCHSILTYFAYKSGNFAFAKDCFVKAYQSSRNFNLRWIPVQAFPAIALVYADEGKHERAIELYTIAWRWKHIANSRWYEDLAGHKLAAFQATLPPELVERARKRGEAADMWQAVKQLHKELQAELSDSGQ